MNYDDIIIVRLSVLSLLIFWGKNNVFVSIVSHQLGLLTCIGVRANVHLGGQTQFLPEWIQWFSGGGGGGSSINFPGSIFSGGGGGSSRNFPGSISCGVAEFFPLTPVADPQFVFFPLTAVTDPQFVLFKHVLCFARII